MLSSISELIKKGSQFLKKIGIESYILDAELILAFVLKVEKIYLIINSRKLVELKDERKFFILIDERRKFKPIAQIIGYKDFWKNRFLINKSTLIPRPETEILIEEVLKSFLNKEEKLYFADFGSGTGCVGLSLLEEYKNARCIFVEKSKNAIDCNKKNARALKLSNRSVFLNCSWNNIKIREKFDFIVSNPPYISKKVKGDLMLDVKNFEPPRALYANNNGAKCYIEILKLATKFLKKSGYLFFEIDSNYPEIVLPKKYWLVKIVNDLQNLPRVMILQFVP